MIGDFKAMGYLVRVLSILVGLLILVHGAQGSPQGEFCFSASLDYRYDMGCRRESPRDEHYYPCLI